MIDLIHLKSVSGNVNSKSIQKRDGIQKKFNFFHLAFYQTEWYGFLVFVFILNLCANLDIVLEWEKSHFLNL